MISDLGHAAFAVNDFDVALAFYAKLGLNESFRLNHPDGSVMLVYLHISGDRFLELFPNGPEPDANRVHSFRHLCLLSDDIRGLIDQLRSFDIQIDRDVTKGLDNNLQAWIRDPDGNPIEFMQIDQSSPQWKIAHGQSPS